MASPERGTTPPPDQDDLRLFPPALQRLAAASGIGFVVLIVLSIALSPGDLPDFGDPPQDYAREAEEDRDRFELIALLAGLASLEFYWFVGYLRGVLARAEVAVRGYSRLADIAFAGGIAAGVMFSIGAALSVAGTSSPSGTDPSVIRGLVHAGAAVSTLSGAGLATLLLAAGLLIVKVRPLPRWLGFVALVAGALYVISIFSILTFDEPDTGAGVVFLPALLLTLIWVLGSSIVLIRAVGQPSLAGRQTPA